MKNLRTTIATFGAAAVVAVALIPTSAAAADDVAFASPEFKACVNEALGQAADAAISTAQAGSITDLTCTDKTFTDLSDVALLPALETLDISRGAAYDLSPVADEGIEVTAEDMLVTLPAVEPGATVTNPLRSLLNAPVIPAPAAAAASVTVDPATGDWTFTAPVESSTDAPILTWDSADAAANSSFSGSVVQSAAAAAITPPIDAAPPVVTVQPESQTVTEGDALTFAADATSEGPVTVQWMASFDGGATWQVPSEGGTDKTLAIDFAPLEWSGALIRAEFTNSAGTVSTEAATLTVNALTGPPTVLTQPADLTVTEGETAEFKATATHGYEEFDYEWYMSTDGGATWEVVEAEEVDAPSEDEAAMTPFSVQGAETWVRFTAALKDDGLMFKAEFTNVDGSVMTEPATLTVLPIAGAATPTPETPATAAPTNNAKLANTGANNTLIFAAIAGALVVAGAAAVVVVRRKRHAA